jgi:hypothetical protein
VVLAENDDLVDWVTRNVGLPLGNLTSQFLGNLYLNDLDHFIKQELKVPAYLRYVDDMILLADSKKQLWLWCDQIEQFLAIERIGIHPCKKTLTPVSAGLDVLGYRVFPNRTCLGRGSGYRFRRKLKRLAQAFRDERITLDNIKPHVAGWMGHARQADSLGLCKAILSKVYFIKGGMAKRSPGGSGRFVEPQSTEPCGRQTVTGTTPMKPITTSVFVSPVRPQTSLSRTIQGLAWHAAGAHMPCLLAAQDRQTKSLPRSADSSPNLDKGCYLFLLLFCGFIPGANAESVEAAHDRASIKAVITEADGKGEVDKVSPLRGKTPESIKITQTLVETCRRADDKQAPAMVVIKPGRFLMGSPDGNTK